MKKYIIIAAVTATYLALCAAVWPQTEAAEETPASLRISVVGDPTPTVEDTISKTETAPPTEEEKVEIPQAEPSEEVAVVLEVQPTLESEQEHEPDPAPIPEPTPLQAVADPQPGDMVYVPGFGWLECQGPGEVIYAEDIYESGNKIGIMG